MDVLDKGNVKVCVALNARPHPTCLHFSKHHCRELTRLKAMGYVCVCVIFSVPIKILPICCRKSIALLPCECIQAAIQMEKKSVCIKAVIDKSGSPVIASFLIPAGMRKGKARCKASACVCRSSQV